MAIATWLACAFFAAVIAKMRNVDEGGFVYFVLGVLFGPFALIAACVAPGYPRPFPKAIKTRLCPFCLSEIKAAATVCRHCQREVLFAQ